MTPAALPDLYRGEPLVLAAKLDKLAGSVEIKGRIGDRPWSVTLPLANAAEGKGLSKLWARRKIADAEVARTMRQATPGGGRQGHPRAGAGASAGDAADQPGRGRQDAEPARRRAAQAHASCRSTCRPAGTSTRCSASGRSRSSPPAERRAEATMRGCSSRRRSARCRSSPPRPAPSSLPKTATDAELKMIAGVDPAGARLILLVFNRRQTFAR